jgi:hypothetical protein
MLKAALDQMKEEERYAKPDVALIHLGTNDVNGRIDSKTNRNLTVEQVWDQESKASYVSILNTLRTHAYGNPNIKIYIATIIPAAYPGDKCDSTPAGGINFAANCDSFEYEQGKKNQVERFNDKLKDWCGIEDVAGQEYVKRCKNLSTANSPVYLVDHYKYWTTHRDNSANILWLIPGDAVHPNRTGECRMAVTWYDAIADTEYADLDTAPGDFCDAYVEKYKTPVVDDGCEPVAGNLIDNFCFDRRRASWRFRMPAYGTFVASDVGSYSGSYAAEVTVSRAGKNTQLYQLGLDLEPNTEYELSFAAYSSDGGDMSVWVHQHRPPYTHYGLDGQRVRLDTSWQSFTYTFTTPDLADMDPARLRFWFKPYAQSGTVYHIDRVVLRQTP